MRWRFTLNPDTDNKVISEPIGWAEIEFVLKRDKTWHGVFFEYGLPLKFYNDPQDSTKDAYTYIKTEYESAGVEGSVILKVELACDDTDDFDEEGEWKLNFSTYRETIGTLCMAELNLEPSSDLMTFKNRYDQKAWAGATESFGGVELEAYDGLPLDDVDIPPVTIILASTLNSGNVNDLIFTEIDTIVAGTGTADHDVICYTNIALNVGQGYDNDAPTMRDEVTVRNVVANEFVSYADIQPLFTMTYGGEYTFKIDFTVNVSIAAATAAINHDCGSTNQFNDYELKIYFEYGATSTVLATVSDVDCFTLEQATINYDGTQVVTISPGDEVRIFARIYAHGKWDKLLLSAVDVNWAVGLASLQLNMDVLASTIVDSTTADMYLVNELGSRILEVITDDRLRLLSNYYGRNNSEPYPAPDNIDGPGSLRALTKGLIIRQSVLGVMYMSFKDFFEGLNAIDNIGIGFENDTERREPGYQVVRVEKAPYFYTSSLLATLDKVPLVEIEVLQDEHYSIFKIGYNKWETEEFYGLDELHAQREYRTTLSSIKNTLEKVSNFVASSYAIELTRRNPYDVGTKVDWRYDNDYFIFCMERGVGAGVYTVEQGNITGSSNLIDGGTVLNYRLSPVRNAMRWAKTILNSYRDPEAGESVMDYGVGTGNTIASGLMTGDFPIEAAAISEDADIDTTVFADPNEARPIYLPETWKFKYPLSLSQYNTIKAAPTGTIRARFGQEATYRDFYIRNINYRPNQGLAEFILLPQRAFPVDECTIYILQTRGTGTAEIGSALFVGADVNNLFVFIGGHLQKMLDVNPANNEIVSFDDTTGYFTLDAPVPAGAQITIIHIPPGDGACDNCIHRFDGRGSGAAAVTLTDFGSGALSNMFVFYNGELMKYNDNNPANNELVSYVSGTEVLTFAGPTNANRELRVFGFANCSCIKTFSGKGDGTTSPSVTGLGTDVTLGNTLFFYNGNLQVYNDADPANNDISLFSTATSELFFNNPTNANRELRAVKLVNC